MVVTITKDLLMSENLLDNYNDHLVKITKTVYDINKSILIILSLLF